MSAIQTEKRGWVREIGPTPGQYRPTTEPGLPPAWWRTNPRYSLYMVRELSSVTNALWSLRLLLLLDRLRQGEDAYETALAGERRPPIVALNVLTLILAVVHAVTFLLAAGKGPTLRAPNGRVPERTIAAAAFAGWAVASLAVLLVLVFGGRKDKVGGPGDYDHA
jgi:fumarate reductase subunit C